MGRTTYYSLFFFVFFSLSDCLLAVAIGRRAVADSQGGSASARSEGKPSVSSGSTSVQGNYQQTLRQDDAALRFEAAFGTADEPISKPITTPLTDRDRSSSFMTSASSQAPSALQSIMEQGKQCQASSTILFNTSVLQRWFGRNSSESTF